MSLEAFAKIADASRLLLERGFTEETVSECLGLVGRAIGVDRVYIFENVTTAEGELACAQRYEWAEGVKPEIDNPTLQEVPYAQILPEWSTTLAEGKPVYGLVEDLPKELQDILRPQDIISILICPITLNGRWWGFVGFDDCHTPRDWPAEEVAVLRTLARALGGSLRHTQMQSTLRAAREQLQEVLSSTTERKG
ncbi:MAG TPA: GAF domain-containing protein [Myxococcaceae bacterium]|nr:GAF domain-containing protein [Myxococcaceae bacterium]